MHPRRLSGGWPCPIGIGKSPPRSPRNHYADLFRSVKRTVVEAISLFDFQRSDYGWLTLDVLIPQMARYCVHSSLGAVYIQI